MIVADTSVWIDFFNDNKNVQSEYLDFAIQTGAILLTDLILTELLQGFVKEKEFQLAKKNLLKFEIADNLNLQLALKSADNFRFLKTKGYSIKRTTDCLIATFCIENNHFILHNDKDFIPFEKLLGLKNVLTFLQ